MQALFYMDMDRKFTHEMFELFRAGFVESDDSLINAVPFSEALVFGVVDKKDEIDSFLDRFSSNWKLSRMSGVDRNVMRIAIYEMLFCTDIPFKVSINEAIDIGKKFGTRESGSFINGMLDTIRIDLEKKGFKK